MKVGAIDCDEEKNRPICSRYEVKGFPTLKIFPGSAVTNPKKPGTFVKEPKDYQGARTARAIVDSSLAELPNFALKVTGEKSTTRAKNIDDFLSANNELGKVLLFTTKSTTTPLYKALSVDFNGR